jgi:hypothetical protein
MNDEDLPSGKRLFELARYAIEIERFATRKSPSYEFFVVGLCEEADEAMLT